MATPVGYASTMLLGLICKLSEGSCRKATLNRLQNLNRTNKQRDRQEKEFILHSQFWAMFKVSNLWAREVCLNFIAKFVPNRQTRKRVNKIVVKLYSLF